MARSVAIRYQNEQRMSMYQEFEAQVIRMKTMQKEVQSKYAELLSKAQNVFKSAEERKENNLTFHMVGIRPMSSHKARLELDEIELDSILTVKTNLTRNDNIKKLKRFIHSTFDVPLLCDIMILYAHIVISNDDNAKLHEFGITDRSLLTLAINNKTCMLSKKKTDLLSDKQSNTLSRNVYKPSIHKFQVECVKGFDPITLDADAQTFKMPLCGHLMGKKSLYDYVESQLKDKNTVCLMCPHEKHQHDQQEEEKKEAKYPEITDDDEDWRCAVCDFPNGVDADQCELCDAYKPWSCPRCTFTNIGTSTHCQICHCDNPVVVGHEVLAKDPLCRKFWDYTLVKQILTAQTADKLIEPESLKISNERRKLLNEYYAARYKWSTYKHSASKIPFKFDFQIIEIETKLVFDYNVSEKAVLLAIRDKAHYDAEHGTFSYPKPIQNEHKLSTLTAKLELLSARNTLQNKYDLQKCPKCHTIYYHDQNADDDADDDKQKDKEQDKMQCALCDEDNTFCWQCGKEWGAAHLCDFAFRDQLINILAQSPTKTIGSVSNVPEIRSCPKCSQLITHVTACKHMECRSCKTKFCFVCMKMHKNGGWQCGSSSTVCPIAPRQNDDTLPGNDIIVKRSFDLF